jgi:hypothetical protein
LFTTSAYERPRGGSEFLWIQAAQYLAERGERVTAAVRWRPEACAALDRIAAAGGTVIRLPTQIPHLTVPTRIARRLKLSRSPGEFDWLNTIEPPNLTVSSLCYHLDAYRVAQECTRRGWPYINLMQSAGWQAWPSDDNAELLRAAYANATANCFVAEANRKIVESQIADDVPQAHIVFNPFQVPYNDPPNWPSEKAGFRLACPARYDLAAKALDVLIEVFDQPKWRKRDLTLSLFGEGYNEGTLRRLVARKKLENKVIVAGFTSSIRAIWTEHHGLLLASHSEGLPLAVVEAMLSARPPIVTAVGGSAELIDDERTGFVAAESTPNLVDEAMERAWQRRAEWPVIGRAAAGAVQRKIPANPVEHFCDLLLEIAARA